MFEACICFQCVVCACMLVVEEKLPRFLPVCPGSNHCARVSEPPPPQKKAAGDGLNMLKKTNRNTTLFEDFELTFEVFFESHHSVKTAAGSQGPPFAPKKNKEEDWRGRSSSSGCLPPHPAWELYHMGSV